jgi:hypothetical protein
MVPSMVEIVFDHAARTPDGILGNNSSNTSESVFVHSFLQDIQWNVLGTVHFQQVNP